MNLIDLKFERLKAKGEGALISYFPLGEIGFDTMEMAKTYIENGVDILEIGFPVSNPYLDGKVISNSMARILSKGFDVQWYFNEITKIRNAFKKQPIEAFGYNQIFDQIEMKDFFVLCEKSGVDSILIAGTDSGGMKKLDDLIPSSMYNLRFIPYNYTEAHIKEAKAAAQGYIFLQAMDGVTGARDEVNPGLEEKINDLKQKIEDIPICPGFGISTVAHCRRIKEMGGDGVIVGSTLVEHLITHSLTKTGRFIRALKSGLKQ